ncbi:MAG: ribonuclease P protein component [bacterium]|nr:ribonuclease P protein component [bacterium]
MFSIKKINIVRKKQEFTYIIYQKQFIKNKYFTIFYQPSEQIHFGVSVPKKVTNAVNRNKIRRQIKDIIDKNMILIPDKKDYIIIARKEILNKKYQEIKIELLNAFKKIKGECYEKK